MCLHHQLSTIGRCEYEKTCALLVQLFDESAQRYQDIATTRSQTMDLAIEEGTFFQNGFLLY